jgi:CDP-glycerol glycerophosphotransferase (TagB/SpsB family)
MVACDVYVGDYSSLVSSAVLLEKPVLLTPVPEEVILKGSVIWKLRQFAPILHDAAMLGECLLKAQKEYPFDLLRELAQTVHPHPGQAARRIREEVYRLLGIHAPNGQPEGLDGVDTKRGRG